MTFFLLQFNQPIAIMLPASFSLAFENENGNRNGNCTLIINNARSVMENSATDEGTSESDEWDSHDETNSEKSDHLNANGIMIKEEKEEETNGHIFECKVCNKTFRPSNHNTTSENYNYTTAPTISSQNKRKESPISFDSIHLNSYQNYHKNMKTEKEETGTDEINEDIHLNDWMYENFIEKYNTFM